MASIIGTIWEGINMVHEAACFVMFIHEEALQTLSMAAYLAMKYNRRDLARQVVDHGLNTLIPHVQGMITDWGWLAPYAQGAFQDNVTAAHYLFQNYDRILSGE